MKAVDKPLADGRLVKLASGGVRRTSSRGVHTAERWSTIELTPAILSRIALVVIHVGGDVLDFSTPSVNHQVTLRWMRCTATFVAMFAATDSALAPEQRDALMDLWSSTGGNIGMWTGCEGWGIDDPCDEVGYNPRAVRFLASLSTRLD